MIRRDRRFIYASNTVEIPSTLLPDSFRYPSRYSSKISRSRAVRRILTTLLLERNGLAAKRATESIRALIDVSRGDAELEDRLQHLLDPPVTEYDREQKKWQKRDSARQRKEHEKRAQSNEFIRSHVELVRAPKLENPADISRPQWYSPTLRDDAQDARNALYGLLRTIPGKEAFIALSEIAAVHPSRPWLADYARRRAEEDADFTAWTPSQVRDFHDKLDRTPGNHRELADLAVIRFLDLKDDLENGDESVARILKGVDRETVMRNNLAHELRSRAAGRYTIAQEDELADDKRPDLRFQGVGFDAPATAELKLADCWTGPQLFERLENQLAGDYLRDIRSARGIFVLVNREKNRRWQLSSGSRVEFDGLVAALQAHWESIAAKFPGIDTITVVGIDLSKRFK